MTFTLTIDNLDNAAFSCGDYYGPRNWEIARILRATADKLENGIDGGVTSDINGNKVGRFGFDL